MKKNMFLRVASVLLVLTLLSTCAISGTFAKYVTSGTNADTARVAKWGVTITGVAADANTGFLTNYDDTVVSSTSLAVVAPGTSGTFSNFDISGSPEVDTEVKYVATVDLKGSWVSDDANTYYCPITVKVNGVAVAAGADALDYADKIKAAIEAVSGTYQANDDLSAANDDLVITWEWAFVDEEATNVKDTYLGNIAAAAVATNEETAPIISISVAATVAQVN